MNDKPLRPELLDLAERSGARITGKPDASEPIEIVFSVQAWRKFDRSLSGSIDLTSIKDQTNDG